MLIALAPGEVPSYTHTGIWIGTGIFLVILVAVTAWVVIASRRGDGGRRRKRRRRR